MPDDNDALLFDYDLPRELIAQEPLANRSDARLLVVDRQAQELSHHYVRDLPGLLQAGDRLVLNDTRVIPAKLVGHRSATGGAWQGLLLGVEPNGDWRIVCKTRGRLQERECVTLTDHEGRETLKLWLLDRLEGGEWLAHPESETPSDELLAQVGRVPLPHYIRGGDMAPTDIERYQTVYARKPGAVAAPTAGLHFTKPLLRKIEEVEVDFAAVTLHVGLGTFRPITSDTPDKHQMHAEWCELTAECAQRINGTRAAGGRIIAVGTTAVRTLETAAQHAQPGEAVGPWQGETQLFIRPPHRFAAVDGLMTNFHFPRTTLLLLVQALGGVELVRRAYEEALRERYRFYSYGDAMLIL
ncbi:tRNA preQ1(34) S-adenosylmethionine ribosyltransferase-isomerase QueA [Botrimarina hoheduenensis]|uniref:S-adenosylmethionine:tRNA ribosyltransferase-isomerase n=1 Tax=Botrimarina hoheduenensis TaxID=2528000 RepID=A0A5C5VYD1_9BACT|nr:tRNA preQ1(34) S-adenosylmethionine ribosyltransferase-isomerase QueA [Botrimarina hoheduenensis]TWT42751.1 S-adenosylmethionine:tRNA ribosyltransferase-isomerase [Botrimarina hoheduenensis]